MGKWLLAEKEASDKLKKARENNVKKSEISKNY